MEVLQTSALPLGDGAGWNYERMCRGSGRVRSSGDNSAPVGQRWSASEEEVGAGNGIRTRDFDLGKVALYH